MNDLIPSNLSAGSIDDLSYDDILEFCKLQIEEGLDLDYKANWPKDLAQVMCAFANTQGGLILIGFQEEGKSRKPICPPTGIEGESDSLRQRVINIAFDGIFPPVEPEVAVCMLDSNQGMHVIVIRIQPSRLLHATDRRSKFYIRSLDSKRGYSLASITDLRWLIDRRKPSVDLQKSLLSIARNRADSIAIKFENEESNSAWFNTPYLEIYILPAFPTPPPIITPPELLNQLNVISEVRSDWPNVGKRVPWRNEQWRLVPGGVSLRNRGFVPLLQYIEIGEYCHLYFRFTIDTETAKAINPLASNDHITLKAYVILAYIDISLKFAEKILNTIPKRFPLIISSSLHGLEDTCLHYQFSTTDYLNRRWISLTCPDTEIDLVKLNEPISSTSIDREEIIRLACERLLWSYGIAWNDNQISDALNLLRGIKPA